MLDGPEFTVQLGVKGIALFTSVLIFDLAALGFLPSVTVFFALKPVVAASGIQGRDSHLTMKHGGGAPVSMRLVIELDEEDFVLGIGVLDQR